MHALFVWLTLHALVADPAPSGIAFRQIAESLDFTHFDAPRAALLPEDNGSGVAVGDYDNDGFDDLYVVNLAGPALMSPAELAERSPGRLLRNRGDGTFEDVTDETGLRHVGWDMGSVWADTNDDGWLDLVLTGINEVRLFQSIEGKHFEDVSEAAGLGRLPCLATGPALADYDSDGDLDLYVPCYVDFPWDRARDRPMVSGRPATMTTPASYPPQRNYLFQNNDGRFVDVAESAGVVDEFGRGLQTLFADLDGDALPDLYVANDQSFDRLFRNRGDGTFEDVSIEAGTRDPRAGMGIAFGDYDGDGTEDLFLTHWVGEQNALYRNSSSEEFVLFEDVTYKEGLAPLDQALVGWGTGLVDLDLDGDLDLLIVNGSTIEDEWTLEVLSNPKMIPQAPQVFERRDGRFFEVSDAAGDAFATPIVGRGAAFGDFNRDGLVDVAISVHNGRPLVLENTSRAVGHWLAVALEGRAPNRFGIGARVTVRAGEEVWVQQVLAGESYLSDNSNRLNFGLGGHETVSVSVRWPSGERSMAADVPVDRMVLLREGVPGWQTVPRKGLEPRPWGVSKEVQNASETTD